MDWKRNDIHSFVAFEARLGHVTTSCPSECWGSGGLS